MLDLYDKLRPLLAKKLGVTVTHPSDVVMFVRKDGVMRRIEAHSEKGALFCPWFPAVHDDTLLAETIRFYEEKSNST